MTAVFGQPTPDENLVPGWSVQGNINSGGETGYAQFGVVPAITTVSTALQANAGYPSPAGAENASNAENSGSQGVSILTNPGYAGTGTPLGPITSPTIPASGTAVQNPSGLASLVTITAGTVSAVATAPLVNGVAGTYTTISPGETATEVQITVPGAGFIKLTYSVVPTSWTWVTTN